jgi:hypothetical protein
MWGTILAKAGQLVLTYFIVPLFSKLVVIIANYYKDKMEEDERNKRVDEAVKKYKEAVTDEQKKAAFLELVRSRA